MQDPFPLWDKFCQCATAVSKYINLRRFYSIQFDRSVQFNLVQFDESIPLSGSACQGPQRAALRTRRISLNRIELD